MRHAFFFFNDTATTEIYTLSLHDALPISFPVRYYVFALLFLIFDVEAAFLYPWAVIYRELGLYGFIDRKSTRLNSSHANISYAVFCLKKKNLREPRDSTHHSQQTVRHVL